MPGLVQPADGPALNDLFADDDAKPKISAEERKDLTGMLSDVSNPLVMLTYYRNLFPFKPLFLWLNQDTSAFPLSLSLPPIRRVSARAHATTRLAAAPLSPSICDR